jgi:hypothetical protein
MVCISPIVKPLLNTNLQQQHCKHALVMRGQILGVLHLAGCAGSFLALLQSPVGAMSDG